MENGGWSGNIMYPLQQIPKCREEGSESHFLRILSPPHFLSVNDMDSTREPTTHLLARERLGRDGCARVDVGGWAEQRVAEEQGSARRG
jgi:hypothetical protein